MGFRRNVRSLRRCPRGHLRWLLRLTLLATVLPLLQRCLPLPRLLKLLTPGPTRPHLGPDACTMVRYVDRLLATDFWIYHPNCLKRSLLLYRCLRLTGMEVVFCLGVQPRLGGAAGGQVGTIQGHAWVAHEGRPVFESANNRNAGYRTTFRYPRPAEQEAGAAEAPGVV